MELKNLYRGRIREYAEQCSCKYVAGARPWGEKCDIAMPSATQNELNGRCQDIACQRMYRRIGRC